MLFSCSKTAAGDFPGLQYAALPKNGRPSLHHEMFQREDFLWINLHLEIERIFAV